ncbi:methionine biosynthesis protein MetW [Hydromonas duriensis]|uniref:Methionine biosynthesis protein MetW n=1 Tax=Hydromonas duriensis TaxID=1527608 RepID=A0A4R6YAF6_9BURK|nr:methionine biosynthesis protein MetW [Hydromonas duriensis]TDR32549.1 methionine biosynthesis protein MetW [Hydromonas duriensis]
MSVHTTAIEKELNLADLIAGVERPDFNVISAWVPQGAHVLDLGCGDGSLLHKLRTERDITGYGVELKDSNVQACISKGLNVLQQDLEQGLTWFEDNSFDVAILSLTLQAVHKTEEMLREIVRVGKTAIVSIPNFGYWPHRLSVLKGRMPVSKTLPYQWYNTPNVRVLTIPDFIQLAHDVGTQVLEQVVLRDDKVIRFAPNARGSLAVFKLYKDIQK